MTSNCQTHVCMDVFAYIPQQLTKTVIFYFNTIKDKIMLYLDNHYHKNFMISNNLPRNILS